MRFIELSPDDILWSSRKLSIWYNLITTNHDDGSLIDSTLTRHFRKRKFYQIVSTAEKLLLRESDWTCNLNVNYSNNSASHSKNVLLPDGIFPFYAIWKMAIHDDYSLLQIFKKRNFCHVISAEETLFSSCDWAHILGLCYS